MIRSKSKMVAVIVSYNTRDYLHMCLESLSRHYPFDDMGIIVIDNGSQDDSQEMIRNEFPQVRLICNDNNRGFAAACNQGIAAWDAPYYLLINSDCVFIDDAVTPLIEALERNPGIGLAGGILLYPNRKIQFSGSSLMTLKRLIREQLFFFSAPLLARNRSKIQHLARQRELIKSEIISGAMMCIPRRIIQAIGMLSEDYFMYGEDVEYTLRTRKSGYDTVLVAMSQVVHYGGRSTRKNLVTSMKHSITNNCLLLCELEGKISAYAALAIYFIGSCLRMLLAVIRPGVKAAAWAKLLEDFPALIAHVHASIQRKAHTRISL